MGNGHVPCSPRVTASVVPTATVEATKAVLALAHPALAHTVVAVTRYSYTSNMTSWCYGSPTSQTMVSPETHQTRPMTTTGSDTAAQLTVGDEYSATHRDNNSSVRTSPVTPVLSYNISSVIPHIPYPMSSMSTAVEHVTMMAVRDYSAVSMASESTMMRVYNGPYRLLAQCRP